MAKLTEPGKFLIQLDFQEIIPAGKESKKIGSKAYILSHGIFKDGFTLKEIKGDIEGAEISSKEVRDKLGVYSETELEKLKRDFIDDGLIKQKRNRGPYYLTDLGFKLLETYVNLIRLDKLVKEFEHDQTQNQLNILENLGKFPITSEDLSKERKEELYDMVKHSGMWAGTGIGKQDGSEESNTPKEQMTEAFRQRIKGDKRPLEKLEKKIQRGVAVIEKSKDELSNENCHDEAEEISDMLERITQRVELKELENLEKEDKNRLSDKYSSDQDWDLNI